VAPQRYETKKIHKVLDFEDTWFQNGPHLDTYVKLEPTPDLRNFKKGHLTHPLGFERVPHFDPYVKLEPKRDFKNLKNGHLAHPLGSYTRTYTRLQKLQKGPHSPPSWIRDLSLDTPQPSRQSKIKEKWPNPTTSRIRDLSLDTP
jgi:hypothetical protein